MHRLPLAAESDDVHDASPEHANTDRLIHDVVSQPGKSLDPDTREDMSRQLGHDFSRVRIHTDAEAGAAAHSLGARAFATGQHVVFGAGQFSPTSLTGRTLLAHELTHTIGAAEPESGCGFTVLAAHDRREQSAPCTATTMRAARVEAPALGHNVIGRQTTTPSASLGGSGGGGPARRIVYVDASVFDQINRGNSPIAQALGRLRATADLRVSSWTYNEMVLRPGLPRTASANKVLLEDLRIRVDDPVAMPRRVDLMLAATPKSGITGLSPADAQVAIGARAGGGEVWSVDKGFKSNPQAVKARFGVDVAPESSIAVVPAGSRADYRVGRSLLGLEPVSISVSGVVRRGPAGGGGGGSGGPGGTGPSGNGPGRGTGAATDVRSSRKRTSPSDGTSTTPTSGAKGKATLSGGGVQISSGGAWSLAGRIGAGASAGLTVWEAFSTIDNALTQIEETKTGSVGPQVAAATRAFEHSFPHPDTLKKDRFWFGLELDEEYPLSAAWLHSNGIDAFLVKGHALERMGDELETVRNYVWLQEDLEKEFDERKQKIGPLATELRKRTRVLYDIVHDLEGTIGYLPSSSAQLEVWGIRTTFWNAAQQLGRLDSAVSHRQWQYEQARQLARTRRREAVVVFNFWAPAFIIMWKRVTGFTASPSSFKLD